MKQEIFEQKVEILEQLADLKKEYLILEEKWYKDTTDYLIVKKDESSSVKVMTNGNIPNTAFIADFYVDEYLRNRGFGHKLMEEAFKMCRIYDLHTIYLQVARKNKSAIRLYKSFGFKETKPDDLNILTDPNLYNDYLSMKYIIKNE